MEQEFLTKSFVAPSGFQYVIREENGADEEILSNMASVREGMNISNFISAIVVSTNFTSSGKLTPEDTLDLPVLDRYCILLQSRIFSLGPVLEFTHTWPGAVSPVRYEQDLTELIYDNYENITEEEVKKKPMALPAYGDVEVAQAIKFKGYEVILSSGKKIKFDYLNGHAEKYSLTLPEEKQNRNSDLVARNLCLEVNGKWEKVENFSMFKVREMAEIRNIIGKLDPMWNGLTDIDNPVTLEKTWVSVFAQPRFFFLTEA